MPLPVLVGSIQEQEIIGILQAETRRQLVGTNFIRLNDNLTGLHSYKIPGIGDVATQDYTGADLTITDATDASSLVVLDQMKAFAKTVDKTDINKAPIEVVGNVLRKGVEAIAKDIDTFIFDKIAGTTNLNAVTATALDATNIVKWVLGFGTKLDELDAPTSGRVLAVTPAIAALIAAANLQFNTSSAEEASREGFIGRALGFDIYKTNNLKAGATTGKLCVAGVAEGMDVGIAFQQAGIVEQEKNFKVLAKGLTNYGGVLSQPKYFVKSDATAA
jgi:hypothetical protein